MKYIQLYAERHTGSKWLTSIIIEHFNVDKNLFRLGWKHFFPNINNINHINMNDYLFIILNRNPYDWVKAMHNNPHHAGDHLFNCKLNEFIEKEWYGWHRKGEMGKNAINNPHLVNTEMLFERNPETFKRLKNILELRNYKNKYFLNLKNITSNIYFIRYEDLLTDGENIIKDISNKFDMKLKSEPKINKIDKKPYELSSSIIRKINKGLDWNLERELGYYKKIK